MGYCYSGHLFESRDGMGYAGINLSNLQPIGRLRDGIWSTSRTHEVRKGGELEIYPVVFRWANLERWRAGDTMVVSLDGDGRIMRAAGGTEVRS